MSPCLVRAEPGTSRLQPALIGVKTAEGAPEAAVACAAGDPPPSSSDGSSVARHALSAPPLVAVAAVVAVAAAGAGAGAGGSKLLASQSLTVLPLTAG